MLVGASGLGAYLLVSKSARSIPGFGFDVAQTLAAYAT